MEVISCLVLFGFYSVSFVICMYNSAINVLSDYNNDSKASTHIHLDLPQIAPYLNMRRKWISGYSPGKKYLMKSCKNLKGGLQEVAEQLELERIGPQHQAGSDSLLTGMAFFKMKEMFFEDTIDDTKFSGHLYGLGTSFAVNGTSNNYTNDNGDNTNSS